MESFRPLTEAVLECARGLNFPPGRLGELELVLEEVIVNVIHYAYPAGAEGEIEVACGPAGEEGLRISVLDAGIPFNPLEKGDPDLDAPLEDRTVGGLGIYLVRKLANEVHYRREEGKNVLTLVVNRNPPPA
ncbi:MAG: Serine/threonine-protein kinase BtrW [Syntrophaceae bacterium PtaU1.Bin231]|nr:MAG: Serine/threonine-protein kinase BtrW [Syntrophaceae bacterium PtaU1.Bin231]